MTARVCLRANPAGVGSSSAAQHSANPGSGLRFQGGAAFGSRSTTVRAGVGANRNSVRSHSRERPVARPNAIGVVTYGAATTIMLRCKAGMISHRTRNARSAA
jgi:hypothetical protein